MFEATPDSFFTAEGQARYEGASIDDYGRGVGGYQIMMPSYPTPVWMNRYTDMVKALQECSTLCQLKGRPFRLMSWARVGAGAKGGIPCKTCAPQRPTAHFPRTPRRFNGLSEELPLNAPVATPTTVPVAAPAPAVAVPVAEFRPNGQTLVWVNGQAQLVGQPNYAISHTPYPRIYKGQVYPQTYKDSVRAAQYLATETGKRVYVCSGFGAKCSQKIGVPVVYAHPGGLVRRYDNTTLGTNVVTNVSPEYFRELVAEGDGASYLGQGA
jgi:hypothetical protein